jgi:hypothetical protein
MQGLNRAYFIGVVTDVVKAKKTIYLGTPRVSMALGKPVTGTDIHKLVLGEGITVSPFPCKAGDRMAVECEIHQNKGHATMVVVKILWVAK